jgi:pyruvate dehydrogenase complex dehydrogenase (E1) component
MTIKSNAAASPYAIDREELGEWSDSFDQLMRERGVQGASAVLRMLGERAAASGVSGAEPVTTD